MLGKRWHLLIVAALVTTGWLDVAGAQDSEVTPEMIPESSDGTDEGTPPGWHPLLKASGNFSLGHTKNVPGSADGTSVTLGYLIVGGLDYLSETKEHEWTNDLNAQLGYSRTPVVDAWLKSIDGIDFKSTYLYHIPSVPWLGPFVAFRLSTPMLAGYDVRADDTTTFKLEPNEDQQIGTDGQPIDPEAGQNQLDGGSSRIETHSAGSRIDLTGAFAPLTLRESVGLFAIPVDKKVFKLDIRAGFGAWETFTRDGYVIEDNEDTADYLELRQLQDSVQLGPEVGINASGLIRDNVTYGFNALFMQPVYHNADTDLEGIDLLNMEFDFTLGVQLAEWASLDYQFKAYKQPLIVDAWQISNGLLISINFTFVEADLPAEEEAVDCSLCGEDEAPAEEASAEEAPADETVAEAAPEPAPAPAAAPAPAEEAPAEEAPPAAPEA